MAERPRRRLRVARLVTVAAALALAAVIAYASTFVVAYGELWRRADPLVRTDVARLTPARVHSIDRARDIEQLRALLADARSRGLKVSMSGSRHSQGGHTYVAGGLVLDMRPFNRILAVDTAAVPPRITVESGATWDAVQRAIAPRGLALKVMQSSNIFTVGGTLSANAHGRDTDVTQFVEVVESFRLLLANGDIVRVSRDSNPELFSLVIGGYGMYGVILDVTLQVTRDELYEQSAISLDYREFPGYVARTIQADTSIALMLARPSIDPDPKSFLKEIVVVSWRRSAKGPPLNAFALTEEAHVVRDKFFFGLSRRFDWAKALRWRLQKRVELGAGEERLVTRNNSMRPPLAPLDFLDYTSRRDTDIIQEYYVPVERFVPFMDRFREILRQGKMNVLSSTVRYVTPNATPALAYAPRVPVFAIIQMSNVGLSAEAQAHAASVTQQLVDAALEYGGTYYLTYQLYPTSEQLHRAYPNARHAFERKRVYDPDELFTNHFYEKYGRTQR